MGQFAYDYESFRRKYAGLEDVLGTRQQEYETERIGWAQAAGRREAAAAEETEKVYSNLMAGGDLLSRLRSYTDEVNGISQLAQSGDLYGAYDKYAALQNFVNENRAGLNNVASALSRRGDKDSMSLADTARDMLGSGFNTAKFISDIGTGYAQETTLGAMFRDGETFKNQSSNFARAGLSSPVVKIMSDISEENRGKRDLFGKIVSPLVASQNLSPNRFQLSDYATFLASNWDGLVEDLGQDGLGALVDDALGNRVSVGTAQTMADVVRNIVRKQAEANPETDRAQLVGSAIRQMNRMIQQYGSSSETAGQPVPPSVNRMVTKTAQFVVNGNPNVNFDNLDVQKAMGDVMGVFAKAERLNIPLVNEIGEGGADIRKGISEFVSAAMENRLPDSSNVINRMNGAIETARTMVTGGLQDLPGTLGTDPRQGNGDGARMLGRTSGSAVLDATLTNMWSDLAGILVKGVARGTREDLALSGLGNESPERDELLEKWTSTLVTGCGLSKSVAGSVARAAISKMVGFDGTLRPVNLKETISEIAFDKDVNETTRAGLLRWVKAENLSAEVLAPLEKKVLPMIFDPVVGYGVKNINEAAPYLTQLAQKSVDMMANGFDPTSVYTDFAKNGRSYVPTGRYFITGSLVAQDPRDSPIYKEAVKAQEKGEATYTLPSKSGFGGQKIPLDPEGKGLTRVLSMVMLSYSRQGYPEVMAPGSFGDLDNVVIPSMWVGGQEMPSLRKDGFTKNREEFMNLQRLYYGFYQRQQAEQAAATAAAAKKAATKEED